VDFLRWKQNLEPGKARFLSNRNCGKKPDS
jgi:hypothetical protein